MKYLSKKDFSFRNSQRHRTLALFVIGCFSLIGLTALGFYWLKYRPTTSGTAIPSPLKIAIGEAGIYEVTGADLKAADPSWSKVDPENIQLSFRGQPQPLEIDGQGISYRLRFYARASDSRYSQESYYFLRVGPAANAMTVDQITNSPVGVPTDHYTATVHAEQNLTYSPQVKEGEHWFWKSVPAPQSQDFEVNLTSIAPGPSLIQMEIWASTSAQVSPDHHVLVFVNGHQVLEQSWDGAGRKTLTAIVPDGTLVDGNNLVTLALPGDTGAAAEICFVDWIEVQFPRLVKIDGDRMSYVGSAKPLKLTGFNALPAIYDVTDLAGARRVNIGTVGNEIIFQGELHHRYEVVGAKGYRKPLRLSPAVSQPDLLKVIGADYIAIGPIDLLQPLQPLLDYRKANGLQPMTVPVEAIYDQFNEGFPEPEALRAFLAYTVTSWNPGPRFVLLVGDTSYDMRGYISPPETNRLPTFFIMTEFGGETASDALIVQVNDDPWPDLAVGRIPAREPAQVRTVVEKILAYEQKPTSGDWQKNILAIADGQDPSFKEDAKTFLSLFPTTNHGELYSPEAGIQDANEKIKTYLDQGYFLVSYFGHGSINLWGKDRLFNTDDINTLTNGDRLPVIWNFSCLTGLFTHPKVLSMAETFLWRENGGAVAILAPTSLTLPNDQSFLSKGLVEAMIEDSSLPLGDILLKAQRQIPLENSGAEEVLWTYLLFGDPALKWSTLNLNH